MGRIARYGKAIAREGCGEELAELLVGAADALADDPGCEIYLISRQKGVPDIVWVTEVWRSHADLDASSANMSGSPDVAAAMAIVDDWEMIELDLLGGKG